MGSLRVKGRERAVCDGGDGNQGGEQDAFSPKRSHNHEGAGGVRERAYGVSESRNDLREGDS